MNSNRTLLYKPQVKDLGKLKDLFFKAVEILEEANDFRAKYTEDLAAQSPEQRHITNSFLDGMEFRGRCVKSWLMHPAEFDKETSLKDLADSDHTLLPVAKPSALKDMKQMDDMASSVRSFKNMEQVIKMQNAWPEAVQTAEQLVKGVGEGVLGHQVPLEGVEAGFCPQEETRGGCEGEG